MKVMEGFAPMHHAQYVLDCMRCITSPCPYPCLSIRPITTTRAKMGHIA